MVRRYKRSGTTYKQTEMKSGFTGLDQYIKAFVDMNVEGMAEKASRWADETLQDFKNNVPVDTGNLRNSLDIRVDGNGISVGVNQDKLIGPKKMRSLKDDAPRLTKQNFETMKRNLTRGLTSVKRYKARIAALEGNPALFRIGKMRYIPPYNYVPFAEKNTRQTGLSGAVLTNFTTTIWRELAKANAREIFR